MASEGIDIKIGVDPSAAVEGINDVDDALEKIDDQLGDVAKSGDQDLGKIEASLKDLNREALRTGDAMDKSLGKKTKAAAKEGASSLQEFKDESNQIARETATSFDGSAESIADVFRDLAANAFQGFGPAGAAAGIAIAVGIGLGAKAFEDGQASAEELKTRIGELAGALIESGGDLNLDYVVDTLKALATGSGNGQKSLAELKKTADDAGLSFGDLSQAVANNIDNYDELIKKATDYTYELAAQRDATDQFDQATLDGIAKKQFATDAYISILEDAQRVAEGAALAEQAVAEAGISELEVKRDLVSQLNEQYDEAAGSAADYINAETGVADVQGFIDAMAARKKAIEDYTAALTSNQFTPEQQKALNDMGFEAGSQFMQLYNQGTEAQKGELKTILTTAATDSSGAAIDTIDKAFATADVSKIPADIDLSQADQTLASWRPDQKTIDVLVRWKDARTGQVIP